MRPTDIPPYSQVVEEMRVGCQKEIGDLLKTHYDSLTDSQKRILSKTYKTWMYVMLITIIVFFIMYFIRSAEISKINQLVKNEVGNTNVYAAALKGTNIAEVKKKGKVNSKIHFLLRCSPVPPDARICNVFPGLKCVSLKNTDLVTNAVRFRWVRRNGKQTQVYYFTQAMMVVGCDFMEKFSFDLRREGLLGKMMGREKTQLENREFEKRFSIRNNDEVKMRQSFTPLIQENYLKYDQEHKLPCLKIIKDGDLIYVVWQSRMDYLTVQGSKLEEGTLEGITNMVWDNVRRDLSEFYTASAYACSLPFFKPQRTKQKDVESKKSHTRLLRGFIGAALREGAPAEIINELDNEDEDSTEGILNEIMADEDDWSEDLLEDDND